MKTLGPKCGGTLFLFFDNRREIIATVNGFHLPHFTAKMIFPDNSSRLAIKLW